MTLFSSLRATLVWLCGVAALFIASPAVHADTPIVIVVTNGMTVPEGNGRFNNQSFQVVLNDSGQVAFQAVLSGALGGSNNVGIYRGDAIPGNLTNIVRKGQAAPDGNGIFNNVLQTTGSADYPPTLNNAGEVAFSATLANTIGMTNNSGLFRGSGGVITQIVRKGWAAPDGNGIYDTFPFSPPLNASGQVAFHSDLTGSANPNQNEGIFRGNGATLTQIQRSAYPVGSFGSFDPLGIPSLNDLGQVAYWAHIVGGANTSCVFRADGATITRMAYSHEPAPDGNGFLGVSFSDPVLNNSGRVAFSDTVDSTVGGGAFGIFVSDGTLIQIVRRDQPVPDGNGQFGSASGGLYLQSLNNSGQVVFSANITGAAGGTNNTGIYRGNGVTLTKIARQGDSAPDSNAKFSSLGGNAIVAMNDSGQIAFSASLSDGGSSIYFYDDSIGLIKVIRTGDSLLGRPVVALRFDAGVNVGLGNEGSGLNNHGQIAFSFAWGGGANGIAIWNAPEFRITDIRTVTNDVRLTWNTIAGKTNVVQVTPGRPGGSYTNNFTDLSTNIVVSGVGQVSTNYFEVSGATNRPARYYRVRLVP